MHSEVPILKHQEESRSRCTLQCIQDSEEHFTAGLSEKLLYGNQSYKSEGTG